MDRLGEKSEEITSIYKCLCDINRLRILNLLLVGPQCVCQLELVLGIGAVRTSQHLAYLKKRGMVQSEVRGNWRIYSLPEKPSPELAANLACLQDCIFENPRFREDREALRAEDCGPDFPETRSLS
jgi:ArsR family transcriptional regulator